MLMSQFGSVMIVVPRSLKDSTAIAVLSRMVRAGRGGGLLKSKVIFTVLGMFSCKLLLVAFPNVCSVICKLQDFDRGVCGGAVISVQ